MPFHINLNIAGTITAYFQIKYRRSFRDSKMAEINSMLKSSTSQGPPWVTPIDDRNNKMRHQTVANNTRYLVHYSGWLIEKFQRYWYSIRWFSYLLISCYVESVGISILSGFWAHFKHIVFIVTILHLPFSLAAYPTWSAYIPQKPRQSW